jgi:hypothetical protein
MEQRMGTIIPFDRTNHHEDKSMSAAAAELAETEGLARVLVDRESRARGSRIVAREHVARSVGASPGTIENLDRGRLKRSPGGWLRDALKARVIRGLEGELLRLRHEQQIHLQSGGDPRGCEAQEMAADIAKVLASLGRSQ